jgi:thiamine monophosphate synthase
MTHERLADASAGVSLTSLFTGITLAHVNEVLQAGAFLVAIISGLAATWYYIKKSRT